MPRIPSAADITPVGASAGRLPTVRAEAEDFGLAVAQGLMSVSGGISTVGERLLKDAKEPSDGEEQNGQNEEQPAAAAPEDKEASVAAASQAVQTGLLRAQAREQGDQLIADMKRGAVSPGLVARDVVQKFDRAQQEALSNLPPAQREAAKVATAPVRAGVEVRAQQRAHNLQVAGVSEDVAGVLQLLKEQALREPAAAVLYADEGTLQLRALLDTGYLTPDQFDARNSVFRRDLFAASVDAMPAADALSDLEEGHYDAALGDPDLKHFLIEKTAWRLQSETAQGAAAAEGYRRGVRRGEVAPGEYRGPAQAILAAGAMADAELEAEKAYRVRSHLEKLRFAPQEEVVASVGALTPAADAPDAEARLEIQQEVWTQSQMMLRERERDPAGYVMEQPSVAKAYAAAAEDPALLPAAVEARLAAQNAMGLTPEQQNALTLDERAAIADTLRALEPPQRLGALLELVGAYGDQAPAVAADLAEAGFSIEMQLAADPSGGTAAAARLAEASEANAEVKPADGGVIEEGAEKLLSEGLQGDEGQAATKDAQSKEPGRPENGGGDAAPFPTGESAALSFFERVEALSERPNASLKDDFDFSREHATLGERWQPRPMWTEFSGSKSEVLDKQLELLGFLSLADIYKNVGEPTAQERDLIFDVVQLALGIERPPNDEMSVDAAINERILGETEKLISRVGPYHPLAVQRLQTPARRIAFKVGDIERHPLNYPKLLSGDELMAGLELLVQDLEQSSEGGPDLAIASALLDLAPGGAWVQRAAGLALDLIGVVDAMSIKEKAEALTGIVAEFRDRGLLMMPTEGAFSGVPRPN